MPIPSLFSSTTPLSSQPQPQPRLQSDPSPTTSPTSSASPVSQTTTTTTTVKKSPWRALQQRWAERKGVPEPKDANGRGIYSGRTTEEQIQHVRSQKVDSWAWAGHTGAGGGAGGGGA